MATTDGWRRRLPAALLLVALFRATAAADPRTDVVTLRNGDRITGEIIRLDRGRLEFKTDDAGTIYIEWDKVSALEATRVFEVGVSDGRIFLGSLRPGDPRQLVVATSGGPMPLGMPDVTTITPIGRSFWKKLDGSVDVGYSYTRSSEISQLNLNALTVYRKPRFEARVMLSGTLTQSGDDDGRDDRGSLQASYVRYRGKRWFVAGGAGLETNESLGLRLRSQIALAVGPRLVNTNRGQMALGFGIAVNEERGVDYDPTYNVEGMLTFRTSYYRYDSPKTNIDIGFQYFPSFSNGGRHRIQFDASAKQDVWKDVFVALNVFDTFDSRPPSAEFITNDVGVVFSFGLTF
jgi:Protein of unknown function, DUF481